jgi:hypothetical protein
MTKVLNVYSLSVVMIFEALMSGVVLVGAAYLGIPVKTSRATPAHS